MICVSPIPSISLNTSMPHFSSIFTAPHAYIFSICVFFLEHLQFTKQQGKGATS